MELCKVLKKILQRFLSKEKKYYAGKKYAKWFMISFHKKFLLLRRKNITRY